MAVILATQTAEIRRILAQTSLWPIVLRPYLKKTHHKKGLVEWLKVKALSLNSRTTKKSHTHRYSVLMGGKR
jgi:hypothetical protein